MLITGIGHVTTAHENYPAQPITLVVSFIPGGSNDVGARATGQRLNQIWQQPVVVNNRAGAAGTDHVARSHEDKMRGIA